MYDYGYGYQTPDYDTATSIAGGIAAVAAITMIIMLALSILLIIAQWKIYKKAGKPGWAAIVPIYNLIVLLEIVELPLWYIVLFFIPIANIYAMFKIYIELAHKFGKSTGFGIATIFFNFICFPILAFSKNCVYNGNINNNQMNNNFENPQPQNNNDMNYQNNVNSMPNNNMENIIQQPMFNQNINTEINQIQNPQINNIENNNQSMMNQNSNFMKNNTVIGDQNIMPQPVNNQTVENIQTIMPTTETIGSVSRVNTAPPIQEPEINQNNNPVENTVNYDTPTQTTEEPSVIPTMQNIVENQTPIVEQQNIINNQNNTNMQ